MFFRDGVRRIDFILAYRDEEDPEKTKQRETYEKNLQEEGLELEVENKKVNIKWLVGWELEVIQVCLSIFDVNFPLALSRNKERLNMFILFLCHLIFFPLGVQQSIFFHFFLTVK